jgi:hypothetical protein
MRSLDIVSVLVGSAGSLGMAQPSIDALEPQ